MLTAPGVLHMCSRYIMCDPYLKHTCATARRPAGGKTVSHISKCSRCARTCERASWRGKNGRSFVFHAIFHAIFHVIFHASFHVTVQPRSNDLIFTPPRTEMILRLLGDRPNRNFEIRVKNVQTSKGLWNFERKANIDQKCKRPVEFANKRQMYPRL